MTAALTRRALLRGSSVVAVGAVAGYLVVRRSDAARGSGPAGAAANGYGPETTSAARTLAAVEDVPDGGGLVLADERVLLVRTGDEVRAFSATCTHQGCTVDGVTDGVITCPCHGSEFDAGSGDVVTGPAAAPLAEIVVEVTGGVVTLPGGG